MTKSEFTLSLFLFNYVWHSEEVTNKGDIQSTANYYRHLNSDIELYVYTKFHTKFGILMETKYGIYTINMWGHDRYTATYEGILDIVAETVTCPPTKGTS